MQQTKSPIYNFRVNSSLPSTPDELLEIIERSLLNIFKKKKIVINKNTANQVVNAYF